MKVGIQRLNIIDKVNGRGAYRFKVAPPYYSNIHQIYRNLFPLMPNNEFINCTSEERYARYDIEFGVDIILNFVDGTTATIQEKILTTSYTTVTIEHYQNHQTQEPGDWFKLKCDYYFVGYGSEPPNLDRWILLDWNKTKLHSASIPWSSNVNKRDGARASFLYAHFKAFPGECVAAMFLDDELTNSLPSPQKNGHQLPLF